MYYIIVPGRRHCRYYTVDINCSVYIRIKNKIKLPTKYKYERAHLRKTRSTRPTVYRLSLIISIIFNIVIANNNNNNIYLLVFYNNVRRTPFFFYRFICSFFLHIIFITFFFFCAWLREEVIRIGGCILFFSDFP